MIFLQYLMCEYVGPPRNNGTWHCPFCHRPHFTIRPELADCKDRFDCSACGRWGDAADLVKCFHPTVRYPGRRMILDRLREQYESQQQARERWYRRVFCQRYPSLALLLELGFVSGSEAAVYVNESLEKSRTTKKKTRAA